MKTVTQLALVAACSWLSACATAQPPATELGSMPTEAQFPKVEFIFEERVHLAPAVVQGETAMGHRQYIPITGGTIAGPKLNGRVIPGGWDYQLRYASGCGTLSADYFLEADDGTIIHILNESFSCGMPGPGGQRFFFRPRFEAPEPYDWLTRGTFVATLEGDTSGEARDEDGNPVPAIRIKFYEIK